MGHSIFTKIERAIGYSCINLAPIVRPGFATTLSYFFYKRWGMNFVGKPHYLSKFINFDGGDFSLIEIHEGVSISSYVRILTHDWSHTVVAKAHGYFSDKPIGIVEGVSIGAHSMIGSGSIILPGTQIGRGCLIGSGTVVRGKIPDYAIVIGSPGRLVGDTRNLIRKHLQDNNLPLPPDLELNDG